MLAYFAFFGLVGYVLTFWRLRGGAPPVHERQLLALGLSLTAFALIYSSTCSLRASVLLILLAFGLRSSGGDLLAPLNALCAPWRFLRRGPTVPNSYIDDQGETVAIVPPTHTGKFLTQVRQRAGTRLAAQTL